MYQTVHGTVAQLPTMHSCWRVLRVAEQCLVNNFSCRLLSSKLRLSSLCCIRQLVAPPSLQLLSCTRCAMLWAAFDRAISRLVVLVLLAFLCCSATGQPQQQAGFEYVQAAVDDGEASIILVLWGTLGACGDSTSDQLLVHTVSGTIMGRYAVYAGLFDGANVNSAFTPDNCVSLSGRTLNSNGLGLLFAGTDQATPYIWALYNAANTSSSPDNYILSTITDVRVRVRENGTLLSLQPPLLTPLTGSSSAVGPSVGLLLNGGFEQVLSTALTGRTLAGGWTGNYSVMEYATPIRADISTAAGLPGQPSSSQNRYISLLPGGSNCSAAGVSQNSLPLVLGVQYSLSWYASCDAVSGSGSPCSYNVTVIFNGQLRTITHNQSDDSWHHQSLLFNSSAVPTAAMFSTLTAGIHFSQLTGNPSIDSVLLTYVSTHPSIDLPGFPEEWDNHYLSGSLLTGNLSNLSSDDTVAANVTDFFTVLPDGLVESGGFIHTYPGYSWAGVPADSFIEAQGNRNYTFSVRATAFSAGDDSFLGMTVFVGYKSPPTGGAPSTGGAPLSGYKAGISLCPPGSAPNCNAVQNPKASPTRRRLLQFEFATTVASNTAYYACTTDDCNNTALSVTISTPADLLTVFQLAVQLVVYDTDVALTDLQLTSDGSLDSFDISLPLRPSGAVGDPLFTGLMGQLFQVHGISGMVYNLISDAGLQVNARFNFLATGGGPAPSVVVTQPWTHPGTYVSAISFQVRRFSADDSNVDVVLVEAGGRAEGFARVTINGQTVPHPSMWRPDGGALAVRFTQSHVLEVDTVQFSFRLVNSDRFINHEVAPRVSLHSLRCHGLLGQTRRSMRYPTPLRYIAGSVDDYVVWSAENETSLLANDFVFNLFDHSESS